MSYAVGVDIGGSKIAAGLVDGRRVLKKKVVKTPKTRKALLKAILDSIDYVNSSKARGIGIGVAGSVDKDGNWLRSHNIPCVKNIPLKRIVQRRFRKKVEVNNDANCFALEEAVMGAGKNKRCVFGLILGTGTGGGIVIDRKLHNGANFLAGEVGMIGYPDNIEKYCSGRFIKNLARKYRMKPDPYLISEMAGKGHKKARKIYMEFGRNVGYLLSIIINVMNPDMIILGGGVSNNFVFFSSAMMKSMKKHLFYKETHKTAVRLFKNKEYGILGAALLIRH